MQHKGGRWAVFMWCTAVWQRRHRACVSRVVWRRVCRARGWGGGLRGRCARVERAATAEERAVCMVCCSGAAPDPRAATSRDDGGQTIGFRRTARRRLRPAVHEEPSDGSRMRWSSMRASSMRCGRDLRSCATPQGRGSGQRTREAMMTPRPSRRIEVPSIRGLTCRLKNPRHPKAVWPSQQLVQLYQNAALLFTRPLHSLTDCCLIPG